jgi:hypothetical protein
MSDLKFNDLQEHDITLMFVELQKGTESRIRKSGKLIDKIDYWVSLEEYGGIKHYPLVNIFWLAHSTSCTLCTVDIN